MRLDPVDRATLGYLAFASLVTILRWPATRSLPWAVLLGYALVALVALCAAQWRRRGPALAWLGAFYPLIAAGGLYTAIGVLNRAAGVSHDARVQAWEAGLFGGQPACDWIRAQPHAGLSFALHTGYLSYYAILVAAPLVPWLRGQRAAAERVMLVTMLALYCCYAVFLVFPVAGPHYAYALPDGPAKQVLPARVVERVLEAGSAWGTAFPSSHVAASLAAAVSALRVSRLLGATLVGLALLLSFGTVYGQFHYALDALAGALLAAAVLALSARPSRRGVMLPET